MRAFLVALTIAVPGFLAWVAWQAHVASLRAVANEPWDAPAYVWHCVGTSVICAGGPEGPQLDVEVIDFEPNDTSCGLDPINPSWIRLAPRRTIEARRAIDAPWVGDDPVFDRSKETRVVANQTWLRWDLRPPDFH